MLQSLGLKLVSGIAKTVFGQIERNSIFHGIFSTFVDLTKYCDTLTALNLLQWKHGLWQICANIPRRSILHRAQQKSVELEELMV